MEKLLIYTEQIHGFHSKRKRMPSYSEMMDIFGLKSKNAVFKRVEMLIKEGLLEKDEQGRILPLSLVKKVKFLGLITAGFPSPAEEELCDLMSLDQYLISNPHATYMLKVDGDSMVNAGIHAGDLILIQRNLTPKPGDIVIAKVDNEWTLKYFYKTGDKVFLKAANDNYPIIKPKNELIISGVVIANVRKYR